MRTTLKLDAEIINAARKVAAAHDISLGEVISELARRGLEAAAPTARRNVHHSIAQAWFAKASRHSRWPSASH